MFLAKRSQSVRIKLAHQFRKDDSFMLYSDYTAKSLDLRDAIITNVEQDSDGLHIFLELERSTHTCPVCGTLTAHIHDYRTQSKTWISVSNRYSFICENDVTPAPAAINASRKTILSSCAISV